MSKKTKRLCGVCLALCLMFSLLPSVGGYRPMEILAAENGTLQNGALTENADGWTISGTFATESTDYGYGYGFDDGYLSVWTGAYEDAVFTLSQEITGVAAGSYEAGAAVVGSGNQGEPDSADSLTLTVQNTTAGTEVSARLITDGWDNWDNVIYTDGIEIGEGDTVVITISGTMTADDWYGIKNVRFQVKTEAEEAPITVQKIEGLSEDFIHGVDVSSYLSVVQSGAKYYDENGNEANLFDILEDAGVNYVRLRVWNCPFKLDENGDYLYVGEDGTEYSASDVVRSERNEVGFMVYYLADDTPVYRQSYGAGICDVDTAAVIGKLATDHNMRVLIDFHYSDFWADPKKKSVPKAWENMDLTTKAAALSAFTEESLNTLLDAGVDVGMVQIGNEINNGMAGETESSDVCTLLVSASQAVRKVAADRSQDIMVAVHFTDPQQEGYQLGRAAELDAAGVDYDVFATSYYPFWHGSPETLTADLKEIADTYNKKVMVAEVSYAWTFEDGDGYGDVVWSGAGDQEFNYPIDVEGQATAIRNTIAAVAAVGENGIGTFYWEPAWIPVNVYDPDAENASEVLAANEKAWKLYGSGWGTIYANEYDPEIVDDRNGGTWDNQAYFDFEGHVLPSINVYKWVYTGANGPTKVSTVDSASYEMNYKAVPELPATVNANLNDGTSIPVAVTWNAEQVAALQTADFGEYTINGTVEAFSYETRGETVNVEAGTWTTTCTVTVTGTNYVLNGSFEENDGDGSGWTLTNYLDDNAGWPQIGKGSSNAKSGLYYYTAWDGAAIDFSIDQTLDIESIPAGYYTLFAYYQGTGVAEVLDDSALYAVITYKNGETQTYQAEVRINNEWKNFYQAKVSNLQLDADVASIQVGTRLSCTAANAEIGAWVVVDDISLMQTEAIQLPEEPTPEEPTPEEPAPEEPTPDVPAPDTTKTDASSNTSASQTTDTKSAADTAPASDTTQAAASVNTGDNAPVVPVLVMLAAAAAMFIAAAGKRKRVI